MCGRYAVDLLPTELRELLELGEEPELELRYNVAPTQDAPVVRVVPDDGGARELAELRWGLVPFWSKDVSVGARMINARAETVLEKSAFREAFRARRCLVPSSGFFEWKTVGRTKHPYYVTGSGGAPLVYAGLWERWTSRRGERVESFTILTTEPNELLRPLHDRMPVVLGRDDFALWLDPDVPEPEPLTRLLRPAPAASLEMHPVSRRVNSVANDDAACLERVAEPGDGDDAPLFA